MLTTFGNFTTIHFSIINTVLPSYFNHKIIPSKRAILLFKNLNTNRNTLSQ